MLDSYQGKIDSSALIIKWTRDVILQRTSVCTYITEMFDIETTRVKSPLSLSLSLSLFVRRLINGIQNHITNERSSIMREGFDERIDSPLSLYRLSEIKFDIEEPKRRISSEGGDVFSQKDRGKRKKEIGKLSKFRA